MISKPLLLTILTCLLTWNVHAKAPVWKVSKGDRILYIGGTIHVLSAKDYPLPKAFNTAYEASAELVFETDIQGAASPAAQAKFLPVITYQDGRTLKSELKPQTYQALEEFLSVRNLPPAQFNRFTPAGISLMVLTLELQKLGITGEHGVETFFSRRAKNSNRSVDWLEDLDEQLAFIAQWNKLDADEVINTTMRDVGKLKTEWSKLLTAWRTGDLNTLESLAIIEMLREFPAMYEFILADRNRDWMSDIKAKLQTPEVEFVLVGALHLAGKDSLLKMLKEDGYTITQLD